MENSGYKQHSVRYEQQQTPTQTTEVLSETIRKGPEYSRRDSAESVRPTPTNPQYGQTQQQSSQQFVQPQQPNIQQLAPQQYGQAHQQQFGQSYQQPGAQQFGGQSQFQQGFDNQTSPTVGTKTLNMPYNKLQNIGSSLTKTVAKLMHPQPSWQPVPLQSTAVITGASTGIGREFAKTFASSSINLVIVADDTRLTEAVEELRKINPLIRIDSIICDLSSANGPLELFNEIKRLGLTIDILINNAAVARFGKFLDTSPDILYRMLVLDMIGATRLCHLFGREMLARGHGRIINVSSLNAFAPSPNLAVYAASASYIYNFSKALSYELRGTGVSVMCVCPGPTKQTEFPQRAGAGPDHMPKAFKGWFPMVAPQQVAQETMFGLLLNRSTVIPGFSNKIKALAYQFLPTCMLLPLESYLNNI